MVENEAVFRLKVNFKAVRFPGQWSAAKTSCGGHLGAHARDNEAFLLRVKKIELDGVPDAARTVNWRDVGHAGRRASEGAVVERERMKEIGSGAAGWSSAVGGDAARSFPGLC